MWRYEFKDDGFIYLGARSTSLLAEADFWTVEEADAYRAVSRRLFSRLLDRIWRGTLEPGFGRFTDKATGVSIRYLVLQDAVEVKVIVYGVDFDGDDDPGGGPKGPDLDDQIVDWSVVVRRSDGYWVTESLEGCPGFVPDGTRNLLDGEQHGFGLRSSDGVHGSHLIADCDGGFCLVFDVDKHADDFEIAKYKSAENIVSDRNPDRARCFPADSNDNCSSDPAAKQTVLENERVGARSGTARAFVFSKQSVDGSIHAPDRQPVDDQLCGENEGSTDDVSLLAESFFGETYVGQSLSHSSSA